MLAHKKFQGRSLLAVAAFNGDKDTFEAVLTTMETHLDIQKVRYRCLVCGAAHFRLNVPPSLIAWRIAVLLFLTTIHFTVEPFCGAKSSMILRPSSGSCGKPTHEVKRVVGR